ncbi:hypothetical protein [Streptomyces litmocidini]|uniref:Uncharacterized protein n=1 Tax=Streptomyces litmocidini TaxID=67318 RepID=A0ABW7UHZ3_9ACTN
MEETLLLLEELLFPSIADVAVLSVEVVPDPHVGGTQNRVRFHRVIGPTPARVL